MEIEKYLEMNRSHKVDSMNQYGSLSYTQRPENNDDYEYQQTSPRLNQNSKIESSGSAVRGAEDPHDFANRSTSNYIIVEEEDLEQSPSARKRMARQKNNIGRHRGEGGQL